MKYIETSDSHSFTASRKVLLPYLIMPLLFLALTVGIILYPQVMLKSSFGMCRFVVWMLISILVLVAGLQYLLYFFTPQNYLILDNQGMSYRSFLNGWSVPWSNIHKLAYSIFLTYSDPLGESYLDLELNNERSAFQTLNPIAKMILALNRKLIPLWGFTVPLRFLNIKNDDINGFGDIILHYTSAHGVEFSNPKFLREWETYKRKITLTQIFFWLIIGASIAFIVAVVFVADKL